MSAAALLELDLVEESVRAALDLPDSGRGARSGSRLLPCGCWEHPVLHQSEGDPERPWATRWRCSLCRHLKP